MKQERCICSFLTHQNLLVLLLSLLVLAAMLTGFIAGRGNNHVVFLSLHLIRSALHCTMLKLPELVNVVPAVHYAARTLVLPASSVSEPGAASVVKTLV